MTLWVNDSEPIELRPNVSEDELQTVIRAVYKQVLGNQYLMESDRLTSAEALLRNGDISVRQFVNIVAKSELYYSLFFESSSPYRFIELNFKHLLGRPPQDQTEIAEHTRIYNEQGYEAEIDSYIDSDEYIFNFGESIVPYPCYTTTKAGMKTVGFNRTFALNRGDATNDTKKPAQLITDLAASIGTKIKAPVSGMGIYINTGKRFQIAVSNPGVSPVTKQSTVTYEVGYARLSANIQSIQKKGGKIISITEVG